ncbi:unnamed protein product [Brassicogethes aeneus]|uniref:Protein kinase domain-containing protein n=1 Tax=Brassicogethes aeneus TaxID=1431903 RepID=A0A9P0FFQ5_BRAAE|nr:unnamed protein product [Brassicogethes aeneus]
MGNEQSQLAGLDIEEKAVEVSDFWSQHSAIICNSESTTSLTVFTGELLVSSKWSNQTPLEKNSKNLMIYRHPCILKYISSWSKNSKFYLVVEEVKPLNQILGTLNNLQICIGLHSILKALCFLHETASVSHNNICSSAIFVSSNGNWKLGGMEYLCKFSDVTSDFLNKSNSSRYNKAIDPDEVKNMQNNLDRKDAIDVYAFGVMACELLKAKNDDSLPSLSVFLSLCKNSLQNNAIAQRPKLSTLLNHEFFNHEFISIHSCLIVLALKSDDEKAEFFSTLGDRLKGFNEITVAKQLTGLLLSRMVLLSKSASTDFLPIFLNPRKEGEDQSKGLFTLETFKKYVSPILISIFSVRDAQIRLLLLNNFHNFMDTFTRDELKSKILPELLLGIKDTSDHLVSVTLRTLADLVPVLGASTVIGGKRAKFFNDGRPITHPLRKMSRNVKKQENVIETDVTSITSIDSQFAGVDLSERQMPDGEEGETSTEEIEHSVDGGDLDNWEDWDVENPQNQHSNNLEEFGTEQINLSPHIEVEPLGENIPVESTDIHNARKISTKQIVDITDLDIKNQLTEDLNDEFNFFQDMEPIIESTNKFVIPEEKEPELSELSSKLTLNATDVGEEGWGEEDWE